MSLLYINIIEVTFSTALFYILYKTMLKKETFFNLSRIYLLSSLIFSVSIPFLNIHLNLFSSPTSSETNLFSAFAGLRQSYYELNEVIIYASSNKLSQAGILKYVGFVYSLGVMISGSFFMAGLFRIITLIRKHPVEKIGRYKIIYTSEFIVPFSIFNWIIINPEDYSSKDVQKIIEHEKMHSLQLHSIDLAFVEILVILFWFNPFIYSYRKSLREIHEFLADQAVIKKGCNPEEYQKLLFNQATGISLAKFSNSFSYSLSKKRLKMLTMMKSKNNSKIKLLLAVPLIAVSVIFFVNCENNITDSQIDTKTVIQDGEYSISQNTDNKDVVVVTDEKTESEEKVCYTADVMPKFDGGSHDNFRYFIQKNLKYPEGALEKGIHGRVFVSFDVDEKGNVVNPNIARGVHKLLDEEVLRVVNLSPKWEAGINDGKTVKVRFTFPIIFALK